MPAGDADVLKRVQELEQLCVQLNAAGVKSQFSGESSHPRLEHLKRLQRACTWLVDKVRLDEREADMPAQWPQDVDAPALRALLKHGEPGVRSLALRALASLNKPEDIPNIAALLKDEAAGVPWPEGSRLSIPLLQEESVDAPLHYYLWQRDSIAQTARAILFELTGETFDGGTFTEWWTRNSNPQECLWYWEAQMRRDKKSRTDEAVLESIRSNTQVDVNALQVTWREIWRKRFREFSPELELKLLTLSAEFGGSESFYGANQKEKPILSAVDFQRVSADRLLEVLNGKNVWPDVQKSGACPNRLAERLLLTPGVFKPEHAAPLKAIFEKNAQDIWWSGRAAYRIGIARLLPACAENREDPATREGWLRAGVRAEADTFTRGYILRELIQMGLLHDSEFVREYFFKEEPRGAIPNVRESILIGLSTPPLTAQKKDLLLELVLSDRMTAEWLRPLKFMGDDSFQTRAAQSINAHAGKELIDWRELQDLRQPDSAARVFPNILQKLRAMKEK